MAGFGPDDARSAGAGQVAVCCARADAAQVDTVDTPSTSRPAGNVADCCGFPGIADVAPARRKEKNSALVADARKSAAQEAGGLGQGAGGHGAGL